MRLIDQFYSPESVDTYTFVFDEVNPDTGQYTVLPMPQDTFAYSKFVEGDYNPGGDNSELGARVCPNGKHLVEQVMGRLSDEDFPPVA